jgi:hypothetical protein
MNISKIPSGKDITSPPVIAPETVDIEENPIPPQNSAVPAVFI